MTTETKLIERPPESRGAGVRELRDCYAAMSECEARWHAHRGNRWTPWDAEEIGIEVYAHAERAAFLEKWLSCDEVEQAS